MNQRIVFIILFSALLLVLLSCSSNEKKTDGVITIDVLETINNSKTFKLSEIVDDVEIITFESNNESFFDNGSNIYVGEKFIMVYREYSDNEKLLLFTRSGEFLYNIGNKGKGPGEYIRVSFAALYKDDEFLIIVDSGGRKILKFSSKGDFIMERSYLMDSPGLFINSVYFVDKNHFALCYQSPRKTIKDFDKVLIYNANLQLIKKLFPVEQKEGEIYEGPINNVIQPIKEGFLFWAGSKDTVFYVGPDFTPIPKFNLLISDGAHDKDYYKSKNRDFLYMAKNYNQVRYVYDLSNYLFASIYKKGDGWYFMAHNKTNNESFILESHKNCITEKNHLPSIENDLFGIDPHFYQHYFNPNLNIIWTKFTDKSSWEIDYDCVLEKDVKMPAIRDSIIRKMKNCTGIQNPTLVIMHLKD